LVLEALDQADHQSALDAEERARVRAWVIESSLEHSSPLAHDKGWSAPNVGGSFHATVLADARYAPLFDPADPRRCDGCHGVSADKGGAIPCTTCHASAFGLTSCASCHGSGGDPRPKKSTCDTLARRASADLHALHADPSEDSAYPGVPCSSCHVVPERADAKGHANGGRAVVRFDTTKLSTASYDATSRSCSVKTCHASSKPTWTSSASAGRCDACHGNPPSTPMHAIDDCRLCHQGAVQEDGRPLASTHLDGIVEVGKTCDGCHSMGTSPRFAGRSSGAHEAHLVKGRFTAAIPCTSCHVVPRDAADPGHITAEGATVVFSGAAATAGGRSSPAWDRSSAICADVGCHGGDLDGGQRDTPAWSDGAEPIACGGCHGLPPKTTRGGQGVHLPTGAGNCGACHRTPSGQPISVFAETITEEGVLEHINGCVDLEKGCAP
jgi:predicted CxxxxCH...CXXCH cytochrome family protein